MRLGRAASTFATPALNATMLPATAKKNHIPRLDLPKFSGSPSEWPAFAGRFNKRVKTGMTFQDAWIRLEERFYKKRVAQIDSSVCNGIDAAYRRR
uniref:Uncharacterized protein n=1 Tax=Anopheles arabiensis TaxID=7173 RepID=A0A182I5D4_ANOAR